jgi:hypothetical protein
LKGSFQRSAFSCQLKKIVGLFRVALQPVNWRGVMMKSKKMFNTGIVILLSLFFCVFSSGVYAVIAEPINLTTSGEIVGNIFVSSIYEHNSIGNTEDILKVKQDNTYQAIDSAPTLGSLSSDVFKNTTDTVNKLSILLSINEQGNDNNVILDSLEINFSYDGKQYLYSLQGNSININVNQDGNSSYEVLFELELPFDFMTYASLNSESAFDIKASFRSGSTSNGPEVFALTSAYSTVPIPGSIWIFSSLLGLLCFKKKRLKS